MQLDPLDRIICSRQECASFKSFVRDVFKPDKLIIKVNHYHYSESAPEVVSPVNIAEPPESSLKGRIELPGEPVSHEHFERGRVGRLATILEEKPRPLVTASMKPKMVEKICGQSRRGTYV
jgi:hypothetical protein